MSPIAAYTGVVQYQFIIINWSYASLFRFNQHPFPGPGPTQDTTWQVAIRTPRLLWAMTAFQPLLIFDDLGNVSDVFLRTGQQWWKQGRKIPGVASSCHPMPSGGLLSAWLTTAHVHLDHLTEVSFIFKQLQSVLLLGSLTIVLNQLRVDWDNRWCVYTRTVLQWAASFCHICSVFQMFPW